MINWAKQIRQFLRLLGMLQRPTSHAPTPPPVPPAPAPPVIVVPPAPVWPSRKTVLQYRGHLCNLRDAAGRVIWTPALPGATADVRAEWLDVLKLHGGTHVPIGPFDGGPAYPGVDWPNPNWEDHPDAIAALVREILDAEMVPVVFLDGGGRHPVPRIDRTYPMLRDALDGLHDHVLPVIAWEPVVGDWTSDEVSYALNLWHDLAPEFRLGYHGSPERLVGSSNPVEPDDPWQGGESEFYKFHGGEHIDIALYQTRHGRELYEDCSPDTDDCWLNRWRDYVTRIGGGLNGWRVIPLVLFETVAYEYFRGHATGQDARVIASRAKAVADAAGVPFWWGNGAPLE